MTRSNRGAGREEESECVCVWIRLGDIARMVRSKQKKKESSEWIVRDWKQTGRTRRREESSAFPSLLGVIMYHHRQVLSISRMMNLIMAPETNLIKFPPLSLFVSGHTPAFASLSSLFSVSCAGCGKLSAAKSIFGGRKGIHFIN